MNVLVILPTTEKAAEAVQFWKSRLEANDRLYVMTILQPDEEQVGRIDVHRLQVDDARASRLQPRLIRSLGWRLVFYGVGLWDAYLSSIWPELLFNVQSFDPDLIDLRWIRGRKLLKTKLENGRWHVVSSESDLHQKKTDTSWRKYDATKKVSIVLPVYNGQAYLRQSIESCLKQTHRNFELVVVDDCSTDNSPSIIAEYERQDSRIISIRNTKNRRLPGALNVGFAATTGDFLTWTSDDNYYAPNAIERLVRYLCTWPHIDLVCSACRIVEGAGHIQPKVNYRPPPWSLRQENTVFAYFLYQRRVYEQIGDYREDREYVEDYDYWVRLYKRGFQIMRLHEPLYYYRFHEASMTSKIVEAEGLAYGSKVQREHFEFGAS